MPEILPRHILVRAGGRTMLRLGVPLVAGAGIGRTEEGREVFLRGDAVARYAALDGKLLVAGANVLRVDRVDLDGDGFRESAAIVHEPLRQQVWDRATDFAHANWTKVRSSIGNSGAAPDGAATCGALVEDASNNTHFVERSLAGASDNTRQTFYFIARAGTRTWCLIECLRKNNTTRHAYVNLVGPAFGGTALDASDSVRVYGKFFSPFITAPFYIVAMTCDVLSGGTTPLGRLYLATGDGQASYQGNGSSGIGLWLGQFELNARIETSPIVSTDAGNVQRNADSLTAPLSVGRSLLSLYVDVLERGSFVSGAHDARLVTIGHPSSFTPPYFALQSFSNSGYRGILDTGLGLVSTGFIAPAAHGSRLRWAVRMVVVGVDALGVPTVKLQTELRVGSGSIVTAADSATTTLSPGPWVQQAFVLNHGNGGAIEPRAYLDAMLLQGSFGLADCEAVP